MYYCYIHCDETKIIVNVHDLAKVLCIQGWHKKQNKEKQYYQHGPLAINLYFHMYL